MRNIFYRQRAYYKNLPDTRCFPSNLLKTLITNVGKTSLGIYPRLRDSTRHFRKTSNHTTFIGRKTATSNGWVRCVEFGTSGTNAILFWRQSNRTYRTISGMIYYEIVNFWNIKDWAKRSFTSSEKWHPKLSPIITFFPSKFCVYFKNTRVNHSRNVFDSNQPFVEDE